MAPSVSLVGVVRNCADHIDEWVRRGRALADEIVLCVDDSSVDDTWDRACRLADSVHAFEHLAQSDDALDWALRQAHGDWILRLDDDEFGSAALAASLPRLVADRHLTHYRIPRRWVVGDGSGRPGWLSLPPWGTDTSLRLIRNVGSIFRHPGGTHNPVEIDGEGRVIDPSEGVIWHLDLAWRPRPIREAKVASYLSAAPWVPCAALYLYEDYVGNDDIRPVDEHELDGLWPLRAGDLRPSAPGSRSGPPPSNVRRRAAMLLGIAEHADPPPACGVEWLGRDLPDVMVSSTRRVASVTARNRSAIRWRGTGRPLGRLRLWHTWVDCGGSHHGGATIPLPRSVAPGEALTVEFELIAPQQAGQYFVTVDLAVEGVGPMASRGQEALRHTVTVVTADQVSV